MNSDSRSSRRPPANSITSEKPFRLTPSEIERLRDDSRRQGKEAEAFLASEEGRKLFGEPGR